MQITASMVKELRERTGSGMMECKKALQEAEGNVDVAIENMRNPALLRQIRNQVVLRLKVVLLSRSVMMANLLLL